MQLPYIYRTRILILICSLLFLFLPWEAWAEPPKSDSDPHQEVASQCFPSAKECAACHVTIYEEWRGSAHAYASISPMFHKFEQVINDLSQGTIGTFCVRCHSSVGTTLGKSRESAISIPPERGYGKDCKAPEEFHNITMEGITCVTCHRVNEEYGKVNGERRIVEGNIHQPVYGSIGGDGVAEVVANKEAYNVKCSPDEQGRGKNMHCGANKFDQLSKPEFCVSCHQVDVHPGIKLEVVWEQYRASPAAEQGITCQDCHMGKVPGKAEGYEIRSIAKIKKPFGKKRKHANHNFYGPGYSIAHPGIFPHPANGEENTFSLKKWLEFDYRSEWGKEDFEEKVDEGEIEVTFPEEWEDPDDRITAREIVTANLEKLEEVRKLKLQLMEGGSHLSGPFFDDPPELGENLEFYYTVENTNSGHNFPSGSLGAQPEIWLNVALVSPEGKNIWESGYIDKNGDMADLHSLEVLAGNLEHDDQLFNLQTKFLVTNVKGTDREFYIPVNFDVDQIPFIRPSAQPTSVLNHPPFIRMEGRSIPPLGKRDASYNIPGELLKTPGKYKLAVRLRSRPEPIYFMRFVGATTDMEKSMNEKIIDIHPYTVEFEIK